MENCHSFVKLEIPISLSVSCKEPFYVSCDTWWTPPSLTADNNSHKKKKQYFFLIRKWHFFPWNMNDMGRFIFITAGRPGCDLVISVNRDFPKEFIVKWEKNIISSLIVNFIVLIFDSHCYEIYNVPWTWQANLGYLWVIFTQSTAGMVSRWSNCYAM